MKGMFLPMLKDGQTYYRDWRGDYRGVTFHAQIATQDLRLREVINRCERRYCHTV